MKAYSFDAAGNPLSDGATTFTWNAAGKLSTTVNNGKTHAYKYNAMDQRVSKNGPLSSKFTFFFDEAGQLIGEYRDNSSTATPTDDWLVRQETIWLEDIPVAVIRKPTATGPIQIYFIHADHLNTPRVIVNQSNTPVWRWENSHAFGANPPDEDPDGNGQLFEYHPRFPGQYFDKETNLHYNYFRYYESETGRYISPDPIGLAGGLNTYGYALQNPLSFVDPLGLAVETPIDLLSLALSLREFNNNPNLLNALGVAVDGIGALVPFVPAGVGIIRQCDNVFDVAKRGPSATTPVGRRTSPGANGPDAPQTGGAGRHNPQHVNGSTQPVQNSPGVVNGREFSGHAFDQMRNRGVTPTVVDNAISTGTRSAGNTPGTSVFHDTVNNVRVITNRSGRVITVE